MLVQNWQRRRRSAVEYEALGKDFTTRGRRADEQVELLRQLWTQVPPGPALDEARAVVDEAALAAGRDPSTLGIEGRVSWTGNVADLVADTRRWEQSGATHLSVNTMRPGLATVDNHLAALALVAAEIKVRWDARRRGSASGGR